MKKIGIYKIENIKNGKIYIGQTVNYKRRIQHHINDLQNNKHFNKHLQSAYLKYGLDTFKFDLICECAKEELDNLEKFYISKYNSTDEDKGYNMMYGGQSYREFTQEVRDKMSKARKGRKLSELHCKRIGEAKKGFKLSKESIKKANETKKKNMIFHGEKNPNALISDEVAKNILIDLIEGDTVENIANKYLTSKDTVYNLMYNKSYKHIMTEVREDIKNRTSVYMENKIDIAIKLYLDGKSQNAIAKELNISRNTLRREFKKRDICTNFHINQYSKHTNTEVNN